MLDPFIMKAIIGVLFMALSVPTMVIMLLRGSLYITPEISHAALGGAALGVLMQTLLPTQANPFLIVILFCLITAVLTVHVGRGGPQALGLILSVMLAVSVTIYAVVRSWLPIEKRVLLDGYLIGDILLLSEMDIAYLAAASTFTFIVTLAFHREFIYICFDADAAEAFGLNVRLYDLLLFATTSLAVAVIVKAVGVLLSVTLLILPAAASRVIARRIGGMFMASFIIALLSGLSGVIVSFQVNIPTSGAIALISTVAFTIAHLIKIRKPA